MSFQAVVFPGQGSQRPGMAIDFAREFAEASEIFQRASDVLSLDVRALCESDDARLDLTEFTQPCLLTAEVAMFEVLKRRFGWSPEYFGGHSLGEYSALVAAGAMPFEVAVALVRLRGRLMQEAVPEGRGGMTAVILSPMPLNRLRSAAEQWELDVANDNSPREIVLSGTLTGLREAEAVLRPYCKGDGDRLVSLTVSAPFHSRHMRPAESDYREALEGVRGKMRPEVAARVASNFNGGFHSGSTDGLIDGLARQLSGTVRWCENMKALSGAAEGIVEVGPRRPLQGFFREIEVTVPSVVDVRSARRIFREAVQAA